MINERTIKTLCVVLMVIFIAGFDLEKVGFAQEEQPDYTSGVPQYKFAETLEEQETQLKTNPLLKRFHESRKKMAGDPHRPIYHYVNPEGRLNDPNGLCFWQGQWQRYGNHRRDRPKKGADDRIGRPAFSEPRRSNTHHVLQEPGVPTSGIRKTP